MKISVITPTSERPQLLQRLYQLILAQDFKADWEWLIADDSWKPSPFFSNLKDSRVKYFYSETPQTVGFKRTFLNTQAQGDLIIHCDDDDFYSATYFSKIETYLQEADFFNFHSWFCYSVLDKQFYYWATEYILEQHFEIDPQADCIQEVRFTPEWKEVRKDKFIHFNRNGFGFSYAYRNEIGKKYTFPDINEGEDFIFYEKVEKGGAVISHLPDEEALIVHVNHDMNTSKVFPQFRIPLFLMKNLFKEGLDFFEKYPLRADWI